MSCEVSVLDKIECILELPCSTEEHSNFIQEFHQVSVVICCVVIAIFVNSCTAKHFPFIKVLCHKKNATLKNKKNKVKSFRHNQPDPHRHQLF